MNQGEATSGPSGKDAGLRGAPGGRGDMNRPTVLIVDDDRLVSTATRALLEPSHEVLVASDGPSARAVIDSQTQLDVALLDVRLPGEDGLSLLKHLRAVRPTCESIVITSHATFPLAVEAMRLGVFDFLAKPIADPRAIERRVAAAVERKRLRESNEALKHRLDAIGDTPQLIGESAGVRSLRDRIRRIARGKGPVLVLGETGTGKELVARLLHTSSPRAGRPFVAINCAALPETLIDSELFGHEKGAFTGATRRHPGLFQAAHGGTLFLDEVGDLPLQTQARLLRALQEGEVRPVGAVESVQVDVRLIAATNASIEDALRTGRLREDLLHRLHTFRIDVPPLRERTEDVPLLARHLLERYQARTGEEPKTFSDAAMQALTAYAWPGNVRELKSAVEHAATLCEGETLEPDHLPAPVTARWVAPEGTAPVEPYRRARERFERGYLAALLELTKGNISSAARLSGIDRPNLRRLLGRHGLRSRSTGSP